MVPGKCLSPGKDSAMENPGVRWESVLVQKSVCECECVCWPGWARLAPKEDLYFEGSCREHRPPPWLALFTGTQGCSDQQGQGEEGRERRHPESPCPCSVHLSVYCSRWLTHQAGRKHCLAVNDCWLQAGHPPWPPARKGRTLPSKSGRNWNL